MKPADYQAFNHQNGQWNAGNAANRAAGHAPANGVLLVNLGSPDAPDTASVRRYLAEFLWDPRVVEVPRPLWWLILHGIILRFRPSRSARKYATIWRGNESPLIQITRAQTEALRSHLHVQRQDGIDPPLRIEFAMRYGNPSIPSVVSRMLDEGVKRLFILPLYPQYSATTTASIMDAVGDALKKHRWVPELRFLTHYHDHPEYIEACADQIRRYQQEHGEPDRLVLSFHGIPQRYFRQGDPYHCECLKTSRLVREALGWPAERVLTTFQSRFGREPWLQPYTDVTLKKLPGQGVKHVQVFCPGFSADCLETLEEIDEENREIFMEAGGVRFDYIPCLNDQPGHIRALGRIVEEQLAGWQGTLIPNGNAYATYARNREQAS